MPPIDYRRITELADEFTTLWKRLQAFYLDAVVGFHYVTDHLQTEQAKARGFVSDSELDSEQFQDTRLFSYKGILPDEFCTSGIHRATQESRQGTMDRSINFRAMSRWCCLRGPRGTRAHVQRHVRRLVSLSEVNF